MNTMHSTIFHNSLDTLICDNEQIQNIKNELRVNGWYLLRGLDADLKGFSLLMSRLCKKLTFDPARQHSSKETQKVDAGTDAVGLHIENGNTPLPPDIVGFYSEQSAQLGSQTTICDGALLWQSLPKNLKTLFNQPVLVCRTLPEALWKTYIATAFGIQINDVTDEHLQQFLTKVPNQRGKLNQTRELEYQLQINPVISENFGCKHAFANAILGPSYNYEKPTYTFSDGREITESILNEVRDIAEQLTLQVDWRDNDIVLIDNKRVLHGRRKIIGPLSERKLFIGMGSI